MGADYKAIGERFLAEVFGQGRLEVIDELVADDFVEHEEMPGLPAGKEGLREWMTTFRAAFPDLVAKAEDMLVDGDKLVIRGRMSGTHRGEFMGIPPTGKSFDISYIDILQFNADDEVVAHWGVTDAMAMMQQLGVAEAPAA